MNECPNFFLFTTGTKTFYFVKLLELKNFKVYVLVRASIPVIKHHDPKQLEEKSIFSSFQLSGVLTEVSQGWNSRMAGTGRQELKAEAVEECCPVLHGLLSLLSYIIQDLMPRNSTHHNKMCPLRKLLVKNALQTCLQPTLMEELS